MEIVIDKEHRYSVDGEFYPSITQIIVEAGLTNLSVVSDELLERARAFGTACHLACRFWDEGKLDESKLDPALRPYLDSWIKFMREVKPLWFEIEKPLVSQKLKLAGTPDRVGIIGGVISIVDLKTSAVVHVSAEIQTAGYKLLHNENYKDPVLHRYTVKLGPDGYKMKQHTDDITDEKVLYCSLQIYKWKEAKRLTNKFYEEVETI